MGIVAREVIELVFHAVIVCRINKKYIWR